MDGPQYPSENKREDFVKKIVDSIFLKACGVIKTPKLWIILQRKYNVPLDLTWKNESIFTDRFSPNVNNYIIYRAVGTGSAGGQSTKKPTFTFKKVLNYLPLVAEVFYDDN